MSRFQDAYADIKITPRNQYKDFIKETHKLQVEI